MLTAVIFKIWWAPESSGCLFKKMQMPVTHQKPMESEDLEEEPRNVF